MENKEITGQDKDLNEQDELTESDNFDDDYHNDAQEDSDDDLWIINISIK